MLYRCKSSYPEILRFLCNIQAQCSVKRYNEPIQAFNKGKSYARQIKPFNFFLIGVGNSKEVKPITSFSKEPQEAVHRSFIDYKSGEIITGVEYWKRLSDVLLSYVDHKEAKLEGDVGALERKTLNISDFTYVGKEASNIERIGILDMPNYSLYQSKDTFKKEAVEKDLEWALEHSMSRATFYRWRKRFI